jgi:hypothetical protein
MLLPAAENWGATTDDVGRSLPCDDLLCDADLVVHRAVDVAAPPDLVFRWLCQLRVAPYSYDLIDNGGWRSPQRLTPGLDRLVVGQPAMRMFHLASFTKPEQITFCSVGLFGRVAVSYAVTPRDGGSHLYLRIRWTPPDFPVPKAVLNEAMGIGDLVMARRQLLNLKRLAERDAAEVAAEGSS